MTPEDYQRPPATSPPRTDYYYLPTGQTITFICDTVRPFQCLSGGWQLVKDQYGLYLGMFLIIILLAGCVPFTGLMWGAWMAGIYLGLLGRMRGEPSSFNTLSKGFQYFNAAFVVALLSNLPFSLASIGFKLYETRLDQIERDYPGETPIPQEVLMEQLLVIGGLFLFLAICFVVMSVIFAFAYQLVVEFGLSGWQATKASARAARENFGGVTGLALIDLGLSTIGICLCCIGLAFTKPITEAAWAVAYRRVFPAPMPPPATGAPPPPPYGNISTPQQYRGPLGL
jgi:hypothetical protein